MESFLAIVLGLIFGTLSSFISAHAAVKDRHNSVPALIIGLILTIITTVATIILGAPWWATVFGPAVLVFVCTYIMGRINS